MIDELIPLLPKAIRNKAKILAHHLIKHINIGSDGQVIYPDGSTGASFIDHLKYFASPPSMRISAPFDVVKMKEILKNTHAPQSSLRSNVISDSWISL